MLLKLPTKLGLPWYQNTKEKEVQERKKENEERISLGK